MHQACNPDPAVLSRGNYLPLLTVSFCICKTGKTIIPLFLVDELNDILKLVWKVWLSLTGALNKVGWQVRLSLCHGIIGKKSGSHWVGGIRRHWLGERELWILLIFLALPQAHRYLMPGIRHSHQLGSLIQWQKFQRDPGHPRECWFPNLSDYTNNLGEMFEEQTSGPNLRFCYSQSRVGAEKPLFQWLLHESKAASGNCVPQNLSVCAHSVNTYLCVP